MIELRDGSTADNPRLDRLPQYDERSRNFQVRQLLGERRQKSKARYPAHPTLDQGPDGACVGFSIATIVNATPYRRKPELGHADAKERIYWEAQKRDPWEGGSYPGASPRYDGTSVLAGLQVARELGLIDAYYWCGAGSGTPADDVWDALDRYGLVFGVPWYHSMFHPRPDGRLEVEPSSGLAGYHATASASKRYAKLPGLPGKTEHLVWQNTWGSWGTKWYGVPGHCFVTMEDVEYKLLPRSVYGECAALVEP